MKSGPKKILNNHLHCNKIAFTIYILIFLLFDLIQVSPVRSDEISQTPQGLVRSEARVYGSNSGSDLLLQIYYPEISIHSENPVIVFFHGGGWKRGSRLQFSEQAEIIIQNANAVVISVDYPLNRNPVEATRHAAQAICWILKNSKDLKIDPSKVALAGASAGGQIAAALSVQLHKISTPECKNVKMAKVSGLILFNPILDLRKYPELSSAEILEYSPLALASEKFPPTLILQGTKDTTAPLLIAKEFSKKIERFRGGPVSLIEYEGRKHGFFKNSINGDLQSTIQHLLSFLSSQTYIDKTYK